MTERLDMAVNARSAKKFAVLQELAEAYGIDASALEATAKEHGLKDGPYYAMVIRPLFIGSIPGLKVDDDPEGDFKCRVLNAEGKVIENLLAAGELIFGNMFQVRYPASGTGMDTTPYRVSTYTGALAAKTALSDMNK